MFLLATLPYLRPYPVPSLANMTYSGALIKVIYFIYCMFSNELRFFSAFHNPDSLLFELIKKKCDFLMQVNQLLEVLEKQFEYFQTGMNFYVISVHGFKCILSTFALFWSTQHVTIALLLSEPQVPICAHTGRKYGKSNCLINTLCSPHPLYTNKSYN